MFSVLLIIFLIIFLFWFSCVKSIYEQVNNLIISSFTGEEIQIRNSKFKQVKQVCPRHDLLSKHLFFYPGIHAELPELKGMYGVSRIYAFASISIFWGLGGYDLYQPSLVKYSSVAPLHSEFKPVELSTSIL